MTAFLQNGGVPQLHVSSSSQWVEIQRNTFKNWVNEQLKGEGHSIFDIRTDFADGVILVALVETLQRRKLNGCVRQPVHNHEKLHNITIALEAIASDHVTLVSIDSSHITEGNTKLILALLWQLVLRYQIGLSSFQHRGWLLAWVQAVIPECHVTNLTSDWNSGIALHALLEFCKHGLGSNWKHLNPLDRVNNCREGMKLARQHFGIPLVLRPEDLANSNLDELSAITYLSYFTKVGAPGYNATLQRIQPLIRNYPVFNFTTDWKDGRVLCELVHVFGGDVPTWPELHGTNTQRLRQGMEGAVGIGVEPLLTVEELASEGPEHLGVMAYAARFLSLTPGVISETNHQLEYTLVRTPSLRRKQRKTVKASEGPKKDTYSDGVIIYATSHTTVTPDDIKLVAESPMGRLIKMNGDGMYHAQFSEDEIGEWTVTLSVNGQIVDSCKVNVCDPSQVKVTGLKAGMTATPHRFNIDTRGAGRGKLEAEVQTGNRNIPCHIREVDDQRYQASFTPNVAGHYTIAVLYNKAEIRGIIEFSDIPGDWQVDYMTGGPIDLYIGDTADVRVYSMQDGTVCSVPHFIADVTNAPPGGDLEAEVQFGAHRFPADVSEDPDRPGLYKVVFKPRGPGTYRLFIIYNKRLVKGSPFLQEIAELTSPSVEGPGLTKGVVAEPAEFNIDARGFPGQIAIDIQGPHYPINGNVTRHPDGTHTVTYVPEEVGIHRIHVKLDGKDVQSSPYHPKIIDPLKVRVSGGWGPLMDGHERIPLTVNKEKHIPFDASGAGPGELTGNVHGPSDKVPVTIDARGDGKHTLIFTPKEEGKHYIDVFWSGYALPRSPYHGYATYGREEPDYPTVMVSAVNYPPTRIRVQRHGSDISHTNKPRHYLQPKRTGSVYSASTHSAKSEPHYRNRNNNRKEPDVVITRLPRSSPTYLHVDDPSPRELHVYTSSPQGSSPSLSPTYIYSQPQKSPASVASSKAYLLDIKWNGKPLKCCPFKIDVKKPVYPEKVGVTPLTGDLKAGVIGREIDLKIDPREAGHGELTIDCKDPEGHDVPVHLTDNYDGTYRLRVRPQKLGKHILNIRLNKQHVFGSPYAIEIKGKVMTGNVKVWGPGLENGVFPDYQGHFYADATGAGGGELHVSVMGLKGAFHVEMKRASQKDKLFHCLYHPLEPGVYTINVQWSGKHVSGSPYRVVVAASEMDLLEYENKVDSDRIDKPSFPTNIKCNIVFKKRKSLHFRNIDQKTKTIFT
ncbi:FLuncharacterized [Mya arenaria]|uniref:FLuncharacterized n=1 Tax=Mya arenaria TaxID=6604 RepID=A0ABY7G2I7_MYAAR|nr:FLuncharacterized [Mya arenaria]